MVLARQGFFFSRRQPRLRHLHPAGAGLEHPFFGLLKAVYHGMQNTGKRTGFSTRGLL
jgi:hypothetical protein